MIRPLQEGDYPGLVRVLRALRADSIYTAARMRHLAESMPERAQNAAWVADEGGIVGWGWAHRRLWRASDTGYAWVGVLSAARGRGLGSALWELAETHAQTLGVKALFTAVVGDADGERFIRARGFEPGRIERISAVDPRTVDLSELPAREARAREAGYRLASFRDADLHRLYRLGMGAADDMPDGEAPHEMSFDEWRSEIAEQPNLDWDASAVVLRGDEPVSESLLTVDLEGRRARNEFTGTARAHRRHHHRQRRAERRHARDQRAARLPAARRAAPVDEGARHRMSRDSVRIRRATLEDVPHVAAIVRDENPAWVFSDRGWQHRWESVPERARLLALVAVAGSEIVGHGGAALSSNTSVEGAGGLGVTVVASARGRGIGSRLYDALLEHLLSIGARSVFALFPRNGAGERFVRARGFDHVRSAPISRVDPRRVELDVPGNQGFHVLPLSAVRARSRKIFELDAVASLDEPAVNPIDAMRYEEWLRSEWENPDLDFDGSTVVVHGDDLVAFTWLRVDAERGRAVSAFTATLPEFRGRGLATRAKLRTLHWAAEHGITSVTTSNDDSNAAMLAVNRRLGFRPIGTLVTYQRDI